MKFSIAAIAAAVSFGLVSAAPAAVEKRQSAVTDVTVLQYALTLEHLEAAFYAQYLDQFSNQDFINAGFPNWARGRINQIAAHEKQHVELLAGALGDAATKPCTYKFPVTDAKSFVAVASVLESVGVSAYLGAASSIKTPAYVTVAGSILTTEARHQAWISSAGLQGNPWSVPEDTPVSFSPIYTAALQFIESCPETNPTLPFTQFAALTYNAADGSVSYPGMKDGDFIAVYQGLSVGTYPVKNGKVDLPVVFGFAYLTATTEGVATKVGDDNIVAGPFIINNVFNSKIEAPPAPQFSSAA
ncbi:ferritin-like domain-containing protein [Filobasidium floriforme]|uniref:ferritin-like domain-containing protein n=1 Tax=Filobasidium floriforme TaxID=5210 RepID=UPI001E8D8C9D|nr:ferritin-like domain-containing protein [Filobasidium floriforme]KAH8077858.1 ferritin-like domain-containing protein [Filobasidium floriforme]